jgi:hypothetical protein
MYGAAPDCDSLRGYLGDTDNVNLFDPHNSLLAFITAASADCGSSRGLYWAYQDGGYATDIPEADRPKAYCYLDKDDATHCNRTSDEKVNWKTYTATKTAGQELLGKAILAYNRGTAGLSARHYFADTIMLKSDPNKKATGQSFDYWMQIKKITQTRAGITGYVPYVTYLWKGGLGFDKNNNGVDGALENIPDDPDTLDIDETYNENLIPWCFLYGEKDWIAPYEIPVEGKPPKKASYVDYRDDSVDEVSKRLLCTLD